MYKVMRNLCYIQGALTRAATHMSSPTKIISIIVMMRKGKLLGLCRCGDEAFEATRPQFFSPPNIPMEIRREEIKKIKILGLYQNIFKKMYFANIFLTLVAL